LLIRAIVRAHKWLKSLSDGTYDSIEELARALELHPKVVRKGLRLAFLSPAITKELLAGQRRGVQLLRDLEQAAVLRWAEQSQIVDAAYH
jgi:site-specific DNA recombinase